MVKSQRSQKYNDFSEEYCPKRVKIALVNQEVEGVILEARRYWIKVKAGARVIYINKAWIVSIESLEQ